MAVEVWTNIKGFPGYEISSLGQVKDDNHNIIEPYVYGKDGIPWVSFEKGEWSYSGPVWRLVFEGIFVGDHSDIEVSHIGDPTDNRATNLRLKALNPITGEVGVLKLSRTRQGLWKIDKRRFVDFGD